MSLRHPSARLLAAAAVALAVLLPGCGGTDEPAPGPAPVSAGAVSLKAGEKIPAPASTSTQVLRVDGAITTTNRGKALTLDRKTIERLGTQKISLYEPFKKKRMSFVAVPLAKVLSIAGATDGAKTLHAVALNDYSVNIPVSVARQPDVYLATANGDGSKIKLKEGGPIRVVFLDGAKNADVDDYWIWSLASLTVR